VIAKARDDVQSKAVPSTVDASIERFTADAISAGLANYTLSGNLAQLQTNFDQLNAVLGTHGVLALQDVSATMALHDATDQAGAAVAATTPPFAHLGDTIGAVSANVDEMNQSFINSVSAAAGAAAAARSAANAYNAAFAGLGSFQSQLDAASEVAQMRSDHSNDIHAKIDQAAKDSAAMAADQAKIDAAAKAAAASATSAANAIGSGMSSAMTLAGDASSALNTKLQDLKQTLTDLSHPHLLGMGADADKIFALEEKVKAAQLRIDQAEMGGVKGAGLASLQKQESNLQKQLDIANLKDQLKFDDPLRKIAAAAAGPITEVSASAALAGVTQARTAYDLLVPQVDASRDSLRGLKLAIDEAKAALKGLGKGAGVVINVNGAGNPNALAAMLSKALNAGVGSQITGNNTSRVNAPGTLG